MSHPIDSINQIRITGGPHSATTRITDAATGAELRFITDISLKIDASEGPGGLWIAALQASPVEFDLTANVFKRSIKCGRCRAVENNGRKSLTELEVKLFEALRRTTATNAASDAETNEALAEVLRILE